jgi:naphthoate synthase/2-ketocyclohexanecarboxyl-CoA hydrolase
MVGTNGHPGEVQLGTYEDITAVRKGQTVWITIDRADVYNALRTETYGELADAIERAADDVEAGVVVITGAGDKAFSSGGDVKGQALRTPEVGRHHARIAMRLSTAIRDCGMPLIAAVNGYAIGGGHCLHLWCDLTIASDKAKFGQVGTKVGSYPYWGPPQMLARQVGEKRAREMLFLCHQYTAEEALAMGLVNKVVPHEELYAAVEEWCEEILDKSPLYLRLAKQGLNAATDTLYSTLTMGSEALALTYGMEENMEGINSFLEKRKPDFRRFRSHVEAAEKTSAQA